MPNDIFQDLTQVEQQCFDGSILVPNVNGKIGQRTAVLAQLILDISQAFLFVLSLLSIQADFPTPRLHIFMDSIYVAEPRADQVVEGLLSAATLQ